MRKKVVFCYYIVVVLLLFCGSEFQLNFVAFQGNGFNCLFLVVLLFSYCFFFFMFFFFQSKFYFLYFILYVIYIAGQQLQIFNLNLKSKIKSHTIAAPVIFWRWITPTVIALVTTQSVFHW